MDTDGIGTEGNGGNGERRQRGARPEQSYGGRHVTASWFAFFMVVGLVWLFWFLVLLFIFCLHPTKASEKTRLGQNRENSLKEVYLERFEVAGEWPPKGTRKHKNWS